MSCVAALKQNGKVYVAADSLSSTEDKVCYRKDKKMFKNGKYLIGFCGSIRTGQILQRRFWKPPTDIYAVPDSMMNLLEKKGCMSITEEGHKNCGCNFIFATKGEIYEILVDFQLVEPIDDYTAIGSGADFALGSLYSTKGTNLKPEERLKLAIEAASYFSTSVGGEIIIERI
jgi:ATP-dependent protease HslVU (ClpYQ) peptidase subunit